MPISMLEDGFVFGPERMERIVNKIPGTLAEMLAVLLENSRRLKEDLEAKTDHANDLQKRLDKAYAECKQLIEQRDGLRAELVELQEKHLKRAQKRKR
jgi:predicted outer membrane protein